MWQLLMCEVVCVCVISCVIRYFCDIVVFFLSHIVVIKVTCLRFSTPKLTFLFLFLDAASISASSSVSLSDR